MTAFSKADVQNPRVGVELDDRLAESGRPDFRHCSKLRIDSS